MKPVSAQREKHWDPRGCECESSVCVCACECERASERECVRYLRYLSERLDVMFGPRRSRRLMVSTFCPIGANATQRQLGMESNGTVHTRCMCGITHTFLPEVPGYVFYPCWVDDRQYFGFVSGQEEREPGLGNLDTVRSRSCLIFLHHHDMYIGNGSLALGKRRGRNNNKQGKGKH
ncbi:hypothetical protein GGI42DRAFT_289878 [Trichoderma sp. SZMC 28013]